MPKTKELRPPQNQMVKPAEIIAIPGLENWTLSERRIWNILLKNAWDQNMEDPAAEFSIGLEELRNRNEDNKEVWELLKTLAITDVQARQPDGTSVHVQLLGGRKFPDEHGEEGILKYEFSKYLIPILRESEIYARMEMKVVRSLRSKFGMALYEAVAQRINLQKNEEKLKVDELKQWLGIHPSHFLRKNTSGSEVTNWSDLRKRAVEPALRDVNQLSPYNVEIEPHKTGRRVNYVIVRWERKEPLSPEEQSQAQEVNRHSAGRSARISGNVETVKPPELSEKEIQIAYDVAALHERIDIHAAYQDWQEQVMQYSEMPSNPGGHFVEFCRKRAENISSGLSSMMPNKRF